MKDRGLKPGLFFVLAMSSSWALLEMGFLSNSTEAKISSGDFIEDYSSAVSEGVRKFLE